MRRLGGCFVVLVASSSRWRPAAGTTSPRPRRRGRGRRERNPADRLRRRLADGGLPDDRLDSALQLRGSDELATQIREGAPADVYAAASSKYPQELYDEKLVEEPVTFASNRLVLIVPTDNPAGIEKLADVTKPGTKLVIGAEGVPVGDYTRRGARRPRAQCRARQRRLERGRRQGRRRQGLARRGGCRLRVRDGCLPRPATRSASSSSPRARSRRSSTRSPWSRAVPTSRGAEAFVQEVLSSRGTTGARSRRLRSALGGTRGRRLVRANRTHLEVPDHHGTQRAEPAQRHRHERQAGNDHVRGRRGCRQPTDRLGDHPRERRAAGPEEGDEITVVIKATEVLLARE